MPNRKRNWPKGLREKPSGSGNYYWEAYGRHRTPQRKSVPLEANVLRDAKLEARMLQRDYDIGEFNPWRDRHEPSATLAKVIDMYLEAHRRQAPNTRKNKRSLLFQLEQYLSETTARAIAKEVTPRDVEDFMESKNWAASTKRQRLVTLSHFFGWINANGFAEENPAELYKKRSDREQRSFRVRRSKKSNRRPIFPKELIHVAEAVRSYVCESPYASAEYPADAFELFMATGLRRSELCHINRRDVTLRKIDGRAIAGSIHVRFWENPHTGEQFVPKNERAVRRVPLTPRAACIASQHQQEANAENPWEPLLKSTEGKRLNEDTLSQAFAKHRVKVGLTKNVTLHSTRHGYLSCLLLLRVSPYLVRDIAGHADLRTQSRYAHLAEEHMAGHPTAARKKALEFFCPGVEEKILEEVAAGDRSWSNGRLDPFRQSGYGVPIEEILFGGLLYE